MRALDPSPEKVVVSLGCNKGVDAVRQLMMYDFSTPRASLRGWWAAHQEQVPPPGCGSCGQCDDMDGPPPHQPSAAAARRVGKSAVVYCVEALPSNAAMLNASASRLGYDQQYGGHRGGAPRVTHAAAGKAAGCGVPSPAGAEPGVESIGIAGNNGVRLGVEAGAMVTARTTTIDELVAGRRGPRLRGRPGALS